MENTKIEKIRYFGWFSNNMNLLWKLFIHSFLLNCEKPDLVFAMLDWYRINLHRRIPNQGHIWMITKLMIDLFRKQQPLIMLYVLYNVIEVEQHYVLSIINYSQFICRTTEALEAWVMFELEAKHVKVVSTSWRWTGPTTKVDVTTSFSFRLSPRTRCGRDAPSNTSLVEAALRLARPRLAPLEVVADALVDWTWRPLVSQWRLGSGRPETIKFR